MGGTEIDKVKIEEYISKNNIKNVFVHSFVPHKQMPHFMCSADVLVLPNTAKEKRSFKYTTPIKLFEYMASGTPIVASDIPSFEGYLNNKQNALLFEADNPKSLAETVAVVLENKKFAKKISYNSTIDVKKYTWLSRAEKIFEFALK